MSAAIVTGATSGIGRACAVALCDAGWYVLASGRDRTRGEAVARELEARSGGAFVAGDIAEDAVLDGLVERASEEPGGLGLVVNNAGIHFLATVDKTEPADLDRLMAVNLRAAIVLARTAVPVMRARGGGVIVNVASEAGLVAVPDQVAYNVSKAALIMLTKSIAVDHASDGIRAVTVCPGTTRTPLVEDAIRSAPDPAEHERWLASSRPLKRLGTEEEIARVVVFAASEQCSYMTGTEIVVDGGYTAV